MGSELLLGQGTIEGVTWTEGSYSLVQAGSVEGVPASSFVLGDNLLGSWSTENNNLTLVVEQVALLEWKGGDGIWSVTAPASSPWKMTVCTIMLPEWSWEILTEVLCKQ